MGWPQLFSKVPQATVTNIAYHNLRYIILDSHRILGTVHARSEKASQVYYGPPCSPKLGNTRLKRMWDGSRTQPPLRGKHKPHELSFPVSRGWLGNRKAFQNSLNVHKSELKCWWSRDILSLWPWQSPIRYKKLQSIENGRLFLEQNTLGSLQAQYSI